VTCGEDGSVRVWDLHTGKGAAGWNAHDGGALGIAVDSSGRIASVGRDRRLKVWSPAGQLVADLGPTTDQGTRVAWAPDHCSAITGDVAGEVRIWDLGDGRSTRLPMPVVEEPAAVALVVPVMTPARPFVPKAAAPSPTTSPADRVGAKDGPADDLEAALASAREAATAAETSLIKLSQLAQARTQSSTGSRSRRENSRRPEDALVAAKAALASLRAAMEAAPGNMALARAVEETERAVRLLADGTRPPPAARNPATSP
jgi:hypothetical protein